MIQKNSDDILLYEALSAVDWGDAPVPPRGFRCTLARLAGVGRICPTGMSLLRESRRMPWHHDIDLNTRSQPAFPSRQVGQWPCLGDAAFGTFLRKADAQFLPRRHGGPAPFWYCGLQRGRLLLCGQGCRADCDLWLRCGQHWINQARFVAARRERRRRWFSIRGRRSAGSGGDGGMVRRDLVFGAGSTICPIPSAA